MEVAIVPRPQLSKVQLLLSEIAKPDLGPLIAVEHATVAAIEEDCLCILLWHAPLSHRHPAFITF